MKVKVSYQIGIRMGIVTVNVIRGEHNDSIIRKAKMRVNSLYGPITFPTYYESWEILKRD